MDIVVFGITLLFAPGVDSIRNAQLNLLRDLFNDTAGYLPDVRSLIAGDETLKCIVSYSLAQIIKVHETKESVEMSTWFTFEWEDSRMVWNPDDYENLEDITVNFDRLWSPDIVVYNNVAENVMGTAVFAKTPLTVNSTGWVVWDTYAILDTHCNINVEKFPFDIQQCTIDIGSWTLSKEQLTLVPEEDAWASGIYVTSTEWNLLGTSVSEHDITDHTGKVSSTIRVTIDIRRKPLSYVVNILVPSCLLVLLGLTTFYLPSYNAIKVSLGLSVLLTMSFLQTGIADLLPETSNVVPILTRFLILSFAVLMTSIVLSLLFYFMYKSNSELQHLPTWLQFIATTFSCLTSAADREKLEAKKAKLEQAKHFEYQETKRQVLRMVQDLLGSYHEDQMEKKVALVKDLEWRMSIRVLDKICLQICCLLFVALVFVAFV